MTAAAWPRPRGLLLDAMGTLITLRRPLGQTYAEAAHALDEALQQRTQGVQAAAAAVQAVPQSRRHCLCCRF
jgi:putative hydrolase of the HAD superfamily